MAKPMSTPLRRTCLALWAAWAVVLGLPAAGLAQSIDQAVQAYNDDKFEDAAYLFYDVSRNTEDPDDRVKAEYYLAHSLFRAGYLLPAFDFYLEVFTQGEEHPYFLKATEGLLRFSEKMEDDVLVPSVVDRGYTTAFSGLKAEDLNAVNYMVGLLAYNQRDFAESQQFLQAITDEDSPYYIKARYLLAIISVQVARSQGSADYTRAIEYFTEIEDVLVDSTEPRLRKLRRLATLGKARAYYSQGDYEQSVASYQEVPRFSDDWYDAMYESGWAYWHVGEFGKALGMVHSVHSPYFDDRFRPESFVLKATTYFQRCHFDRVRITLDDFFAVYEPMAEELEQWVEGNVSAEEYVDAIVNGAPNLPEKVRLSVATNRKFRRYLQGLQEADREIERARAEFPDGNFKGLLLSLLQDLRAGWLEVTARVVAQKIATHSTFLDNFLNQARIIKFETSDAERKMLEAGKDITKGPRAKGPRPVVPNAKFQYWAFNGEYWVDELGYYQHSIKDECIPEVFQ
ncbi:MAG TPA: hypothetical protein RMG48_06995 [Myxococcales bacterium LLY-WYZ-16_1]|nr:hypothetical protein [Myxococcales bacterium LLY-WYZ-16_1]